MRVSSRKNVFPGFTATVTCCAVWHQKIHISQIMLDTKAKSAYVCASQIFPYFNLVYLAMAFKISVLAWRSQLHCVYDRFSSRSDSSSGPRSDLLHATMLLWLLVQYSFTMCNCSIHVTVLLQYVIQLMCSCNLQQHDWAIEKTSASSNKRITKKRE